ncbi:hypothetical protein BKK79_00025 [Cupriavidus sp. USMAA2-4]|nr:hypothetical protein BKK79_00025 [Cupriavidus sp. USMAA2-4]
MTLIGRDLTAVFIDAKTSMQYQNLTSSQIAEKLAAAHGLSATGHADHHAGRHPTMRATMPACRKSAVSGIC